MATTVPSPPLATDTASVDRSATPQNIDVTVLSYNIFMRIPGVSNGGSGDFKEGRLSEFMTLCEKGQFDIIGLQEMHSNFSSRQRRLINRLARTGGTSIY
jgi:hypothetical protein